MSILTSVLLGVTLKDIIVLFVLTLIVYYFWQYFTDPCKLPGPLGLPIVGYKPFLGDKPHVVLDKLARKYGPIYQMQVGSRKVVFLNSLDVMKEALSKPEFSDRPNIQSIDILLKNSGKCSGFAWSKYGEVQTFSRKLSLRALTMLMNSQMSLAKRLNKEAMDFILKSLAAEENANKVVKSAVAKVIGTLCFGESNQADSIMKTVISIVSDHTTVLTWADYVPLVAWYQRMRKATIAPVMQCYNKFVNQRVEEHKYDGNATEVKDMQDALTNVFLNAPDPSFAEKHEITLKDVKFLGRPLFGAGVTNFAEHYLRALVVLGDRPDIQEKLYHELKKDNFGADSDRSQPLDSREKISYLDAFMLELFRHFSHTALSIVHATSADVYFRGYFIPKGTVVHPNHYHIHHDESIWGNDVDVFRPERFMEGDRGLQKLRRQNVVAFGVGKRRCIGEQFALRELSALIVAAVQHVKFNIGKFSGESPYDVEVGLFLNAKDVNFICEPRQADGA